MDGKREGDYSVVTVREAKDGSATAMPPHAQGLDASRVPDSVRALLPLAERWGVADDTAREALAEAASVDELRELKAAVLQFDDELDEWLGGPESRCVPSSKEYVAFSAMRMLADSL